MTPPPVTSPTAAALPASRADATASRRLATLIALTLTGYPLFGTLVAFTSAPTLVGSIPIRLLVIWLSVLLMRGTARGEGPAMKALHAFWFIYLVRLAYDLVTGRTPGGEGDIVFFVVTGLLPAIGAARTAPHLWDEHRIAKALLVTGAATCALALVLVATGIGANRSLLEGTGRLSFDTVNPITYGHVASTTILAGLLLLPRSRTTAGKAAIVVSMIVALVTLQLAASRGPAVALAAALLGYGVFSLRGGKRAAFLLVVALAGLAMALSMSESSEFSQRFENVEEDQSTLVRLLLQANAIDQFLGSPLTGSAHLELETLLYPHNPFIEAAMATGVFGLGLYVFLNGAFVVRLFKALRSGNRTIAVLSVQYFVGAQFSSSLFEAGTLWVFTAMLLPVAWRIRARKPRRKPAAPPIDPSILPTR